MFMPGPAPVGSSSLSPKLQSQQQQSNVPHSPAVTTPTGGTGGALGTNGTGGIPALVNTNPTGERVSPSSNNASRSRDPHPSTRSRAESNAAIMRSRAQSNAASTPYSNRALEPVPTLVGAGAASGASASPGATLNPGPLLTNLSPRAGASASPSPVTMDSPFILEHKSPNLSSYGHHRQTSIVHGSVHSRAASYSMAMLGKSSPPPPLPANPILGASSPQGIISATSPNNAGAGPSANFGAQPSANPDNEPASLPGPPSLGHVQQHHRYMAGSEQLSSHNWSTNISTGAGTGLQGGNQPIPASLSISNPSINTNVPPLAPEKAAESLSAAPSSSRENITTGNITPISHTTMHSSSRSRQFYGQGHLNQQRSVHLNQPTNPYHQHSRQNSQEAKTVGEYALHHLFNLFVGQANEKTDECLRVMNRYNKPVETVCGPGADPVFDQLIVALGHIAKNKPKPLIDTIMIWRKAKGETALAAKHAYAQQQKDRPASNQHSIGATQHSFQKPGSQPITSHSAGRGIELPGSHPDIPDIHTMQVDQELPAIVTRSDVSIAERRATISVYLVCRVLIEIFNQSTLANITPELADRLEDIIFGQLKAVDAEQIASSPLRMANWRIYGKLLGIMCDHNFGSVTNRFVTDLSHHHRDSERAEILIFGMRNIPIKTQPISAFHKTCDFLSALGRISINCHGQRLKNAYCQLLELFLQPIAADLTCDINNPKWREVHDLLFSRIGHTMNKPRNWPLSFPLYSLLLCTAPKDVFAAHFTPVISSLAAKLKDKPTREAAIKGLCRLVWAYLYRYSDPKGPSKRIDEIVKIAFPSGKKTYLSTEAAVADPLTQLVRIIGHKYPEVCFRSVIFPMVDADTILAAGKDFKIENMEPEKMAIAIRSFLAVMGDLDEEENKVPPFPQDDSRPEPFVAFQFPSGNGRQGSRGHSAKDEAAFRPFNVAKLPTSLQQYYIRFCEILGKITILCDNTFGGQAALDERFGSNAPKTPITDAFGFGRRDDHVGDRDQKQAFYDLLHVAVQALPRCLSDHIPFKSLINLLCTGTAHVNSNIALSSAKSLKAIASQSHAQQVTIGFARFIFNFDARYATMFDDNLLGPGHIESTLQLYVELIRVWIEEFKQKTKDSVEEAEKNATGARGAQLDLSSVFAHVDEIEGHGLFFLCSQSCKVRTYALSLLELVTEFDNAVGKIHTRIIHLLQSDCEEILDVRRDVLTVAERSRLQKPKSGNTTESILMQLCSSEVSYDSSLWEKVFPNVIKVSFERCPFAVTLGREFVCARLVHIHKNVAAIADNAQSAQALNAATLVSTLPHDVLPAALVEQWKLYLIMACTTLTHVGAQSQSQLANAQHARKNSKGERGSLDKITSARSLFAFVIPLLSAGPDAIRDAIIMALSSINKTMYRTLLESLQYAVTMCNEEAKVRIGGHHRTPSMPRRNPQTDLLRTEVTHVYKVTAHFLQDPEVHSDEWIINNIVTYSRDVRIFLNDAEVQGDLEFQKLRIHYCGLVEELFEGINKTDNPARWLSFESRKSAFALMEEWCGFSPNQSQIAQREGRMRKIALTRPRGLWEARSITAIEIEKRSLRIAALSAMASLCGGPVRVITASSAILQYDIKRLLSWIDSIFNSNSDQLHEIGRRALRNLIMYNIDIPLLMEQCIDMCYISASTKVLENYFEVIVQVLTEYEIYPLAHYRIMGAVLLMLGSPDRNIRMKSATLLRTLDERQSKNSRLEDFDISISDKTKTVYKLAQSRISARLAQQHSDLCLIMFSEFSLHFRNVQPDTQRNMVDAILPWVQSIELQVDPDGKPTPTSYMLLANLFEITIKYSASISNEVQALWQGLATGPYAGNVQLVLNFVICLCLEHKEQSFVDYAKQIVVYLARTPSGSKVIEFFILQITPKTMLYERPRDSIITHAPEVKDMPYVADMSSVLPAGNKQSGLSLGQVSLIFLVDLMVAPITIEFDSVIKLIHLSLILWDHYSGTVLEEAREMLVHIIHELVASQIQDSPHDLRVAMEAFVESIRQGDGAVVWKYEDNCFDGEQDIYRVPPSMLHVTKQVVDFFSVVHGDMNEAWAREALSWATSCSVRHLACRSFQVFRCISTSVDPRMLADMLARLSNTIAEQKTDFLTFSIEILTTLKIIIGSLQQSELLRYPQLFWAACACLETIHEREYMEAIGMLERYIENVDLTDKSVLDRLLDAKPPKWEGKFGGIQSLCYLGLKSCVSFERVIRLIHKLSALPNHALIGDSNRLLFAILANLPGFLYQIDLPEKQAEVYEHATRLAQVSEAQGCPELATCLSRYANEDFSSSQDFLHPVMKAIRRYFFATEEVHSFIFLMGLLTNATSWFRMKIMDILSIVLTNVDMSRPDIACYGFDALGPLFRLLRTDLCSRALEVMDHIMAVSSNPLDKHFLRMSMTSSSASRAARREFDTINSLYGIPEPTGWSVPCPTMQSSLTRQNVFAVFCTCSDDVEEGATLQPAAQEPDVELHAEEFNERYYPIVRDDVRDSSEPQPQPDMKELLQRLDSLDDLFDDVSSDVNPEALTDAAIRALSNFKDANANLYDQQTAPLLRKSLGRKPSVSTFHNGLNDYNNHRPSASRAGFSLHAANNSAISSDEASQPQLQRQRTSFHQRSITVPAANNNHYHGTIIAPDGTVMDASSSDTQLTSRTANTHHRQQPSQTQQLTTAFEFVSDSDGDDAILYDSDDQRLRDSSSSPRSPLNYVSTNAGSLPPFAPQPADGPFSFESTMRSSARRLTGTSTKERPVVISRGSPQPPQQPQRANTGLGEPPRVPKVPKEYLDGGNGVKSVPASPQR